MQFEWETLLFLCENCASKNIAVKRTLIFFFFFVKVWYTKNLCPSLLHLRAVNSIYILLECARSFPHKYETGCQKERESKYWKKHVCPLLLHYVKLNVNESVHLKAERCKKTDYIKKCVKQKLCRIEFSTKNSVEAYLYLLQGGAGGLRTFGVLKVL